MRLISVHKRRVFIIMVIVSCVLLLGSWYVTFMSRTGGDVVVEVDGIEQARFPISEEVHYRITTEDNAYNLLVIHDGKAYVEEADCPGLDCVHFAPISKAGQSIICLPHKVNIYITASSGESGGDSFDAMAN